MGNARLAGLALCALAVLGFTISAQERKADEPKKIKLAGEVRDVLVMDLIKGWVESSKVELIYQPSQLSSFKVSILAPSDGKELEAERYPQLVADALEQFKLGIVELSPNRYSIIHLQELITQVPVISVEAAAKLPCWSWAVVLFPVRYGDANAYRATLQNMVSRSGGSVNPAPGWVQQLVVCERADRLRRILATVEAMEAENGRRKTRIFELPEGVNSEMVVGAFSLVLGERSYNVQSTAAAGRFTVIARGMPEQFEECEKLLKALTPIAAQASARAKTESRRYEVAKEAVAIAKGLNELFTNAITATAVPGTNAVIVRATVATHDEVKAALELMK